MKKQTKRKTDTKQLELFLMKVADAADAALCEYWQDREAENRLYAMEYVVRRGLIPEQ